MNIATVNTWILGLLAGDSESDIDVSYLRILKTLKVVRMVWLLEVFKGLWLIIHGILSSVKTIIWVSLLLGMILYVCAIFTLQLIGRNIDYGDLEEMKASTIGEAAG